MLLLEKRQNSLALGFTFKCWSVTKVNGSKIVLTLTPVVLQTYIDVNLTRIHGQTWVNCTLLVHLALVVDNYRLARDSIFKLILQKYFRSLGAFFSKEITVNIFPPDPSRLREVDDAVPALAEEVSSAHWRHWGRHLLLPVWGRWLFLEGGRGLRGQQLELDIVDTASTMVSVVVRVC